MVGYTAEGLEISIHAPRVGSDAMADRFLEQKYKISIHAPRVGSDGTYTADKTFAELFQSTLPVWGATTRFRTFPPPVTFQSTLPVWGATPLHIANRKPAADFNPRSPCGERPRRPENWAICGEFQSTLPVWGATERRCPPRPARHYFNPRSPCGERPDRQLAAEAAKKISIHAPRVGSDEGSARSSILIQISIHAPRVGSDPDFQRMIRDSAISIHAPRVGSDEMPFIRRL